MDYWSPVCHQPPSTFKYGHFLSGIIFDIKTNVFNQCYLLGLIKLCLNVYVRSIWVLGYRAHPLYRMQFVHLTARWRLLLVFWLKLHRWMETVFVVRVSKTTGNLTDIIQICSIIFMINRLLSLFDLSVFVHRPWSISS